MSEPAWPTDGDLLANRVGIFAAEGGWCEDYTLASFKAWYLKGQPLGTPESLALILKPLGKDADEVVARANTPEIAAKFEEETAVARSFGIFGSPSFVVDGEMFWGDDRLEEALAWASGAHDLQKSTEL